MILRNLEFKNFQVLSLCLCTPHIKLTVQVVCNFQFDVVCHKKYIFTGRGHSCLHLIWHFYWYYYVALAFELKKKQFRCKCGEYTALQRYKPKMVNRTFSIRRSSECSRKSESSKMRILHSSWWGEHGKELYHKLDFIGPAIHLSLVPRWSIGWELCQTQPSKPYCLFQALPLPFPVKQVRSPRQVNRVNLGLWK